MYNANPGANPGTVAINVVDCKQSLSDINAALVLNTAFQNGYTQLSQADVDKGLGYTQRELDEIRAFCPATCGDGTTGVYHDDNEYTDANGNSCAALAATDSNGDTIPDCYRSQDYFFPFSTTSFLDPSWLDDPSFRLRGFSCAQWGVPHNGMEVPCMASNDQHWLDRGYTQAELDSLRDNCPATCASPTCAHKHFYYPAWLMNQVRLHCPKACSSSCSGTPFG